MWWFIGLTGQTSNVTNVTFESGSYRVEISRNHQQQFVADARRFGLSNWTALVQSAAQARVANPDQISLIPS